MATQQEILGDKIEAGEAEQQRLAQQHAAAGDDSILQSGYPAQAPVYQQPPAQPYGNRPPVQPHPGGAPAARPTQRPPAPQPRPEQRPVPPRRNEPTDDDYGDYGGSIMIGGSDSW